MGYTVTENGSSFDRGVAAGEISQRLKEHDQHFAKINGSMERVADELQKQTLAIQRMSDAMTANEATVLKTAAALKEAEEARRDRSETRWSPLTRLGVVIGILAAVASVVAIVLANVIH
jgi:methyl-accepting chemotaxis protein